MRKSPLLEHQKKNQVNKKAIYWIGGIISAIVIAISVLLVLNK